MREYRLELIRTVTEVCVVYVESEDLLADPDIADKITDAASEGDWEYTGSVAATVHSFEDRGEV